MPHLLHDERWLENKEKQLHLQAYYASPAANKTKPFARWLNKDHWCKTSKRWGKKQQAHHDTRALERHVHRLLSCHKFGLSARQAGTGQSPVSWVDHKRTSIYWRCGCKIIYYGPLTTQECLRRLFHSRLHTVMLSYHLDPWLVNQPLCIQTKKENETLCLHSCRFAGSFQCSSHKEKQKTHFAKQNRALMIIII